MTADSLAMGSLRAALVTPLSGPLGRFGTSGAAALQLWATRAAFLSAPWSGVDLRVIDAHPSARTAMRTANLLDPHVLFGPYGSGPAIAALQSTQRVVWNHGGATSRLERATFPHTLNVPTPALRYFDAVLRAIRASDMAIRHVVLVHSSTGFGREVAAGAVATARDFGFDLEAVEFAPGEVLKAAERVFSADALLVAGAFDDELAAARLLLGRGWRAAAFVGAGVEEVLEALGAAREGLLGPTQWVARAAEEPDDGPDATWFTAAYTDAVGSEPAYPAAAAFAAGVLAARCVRESASTDDGLVLKTARQLVTRTLFGDFRIDPESGLQIGHEVLVVQWQGGARRVVWPPERAESLIQPLQH